MNFLSPNKQPETRTAKINVACVVGSFFCFPFCDSQSKSFSLSKGKRRSKQKTTGEGARGEGSEKNCLQ